MKIIKSLFSKTILFILLSSLTSYLVMALIYPDLFVNQKVSFIRFGDTEHNYYGTFTMLSNIFHGGIALWNNYDQMPLAYFWLTGGLTYFSNLITELFYFIISPFFSFLGEFFHKFYSIFYYVPFILINTSGMYLLIKRFTKHKLVLFLSLVLGSSILMPQIFLGLNTGSLYSFFPLIAHFILNFFEKWKFRDLLFAVLVMAVLLAMDFHSAIGYFYQGVHLFLIATILWFLVTHKGKFTSYFSILKNQLSYKLMLQIVLVFSLSVLLLSPWFFLFKLNYKDYDFGGEEKQRMANISILNPASYFNLPTFTAPKKEFPSRLIDYEHNDWDRSWLFLGFGAFFLTIVGIVMGKDSRRFIFLLTIAFFWLINSPRVMTDRYSLIHWLNAFTNPFNFIVRSFHMSGSFLLPFVVVPLLTSGLEALKDIVGESKNHNLLKKIFLVILLELLFLLKILPDISVNVRNYFIVGFLISISLFLVLLKKNLNSQAQKIFLLVAILSIIFIDSTKLRVYLRLISEKMTVISHTFDNSNKSYFIDYQNPKILPFRSYATSLPIPKVSGYLYIDPNNMQGLFYRFTDMQKYFNRGSIYKPRHTSFARLAYDKTLQTYIQKDNRIIYQADVAIEQKEGELQKLLDRNLDRIVILVDGLPSESTMYSKNLPLDYKVTNNKPPSIPLKSIEINFAIGQKIEKSDFDIYLFNLPADFPKYLSTGIFTDDKSLIRLTLNGREFNPVQGTLISTFSFDVQNIVTGKLVLSLPKNFQVESQIFSFEYPIQYSTNITKITKYEPDNFGFNYKTDKNGWLVFHYPYDIKWKITVDGKETEFYRANYSFLTIPITSGNHEILVQYYPNALLRTMMLVSILLILTLPFAVIAIELRRDKNRLLSG